MPFFTTGRRPIRQAATSICIALASSVSSAGYTVIDDDLLPSSALEARNAAMSGRGTAANDQFSIGFYRQQSALGVASRGALDTLLPILKSAGAIRIVGRADATPQPALAQARAQAVKAYLERQGVSTGRISIELDNSPNPQPAGATYGISLVVQRDVPTPSYAAQDFVEPQPRSIARPDPASYYAMATSQAGSTPAAQTPASISDQQLIQYINHAVMSGQMQPAVALQLLRAMATGANPMASAGGMAAPLPQAPLQMPSSWVLDKRLSLRANIDAWARSAGWGPTRWEASEAFAVTDTLTVTGVFPDVLRRVADATGLNICPSPRQRFIRVTNAGVACDK